MWIYFFLQMLFLQAKMNRFIILIIQSKQHTGTVCQSIFYELYVTFYHLESMHSMYAYYISLHKCQWQYYN